MEPRLIAAFALIGMSSASSLAWAVAWARKRRLRKLRLRGIKSYERT